MFFVYPVKNLVSFVKKKNRNIYGKMCIFGRNCYGHITLRGRGGGVKRSYRFVQTKASNYDYFGSDLYGQVKQVYYNPNCSSLLLGLIACTFYKTYLKIY